MAHEGRSDSGKEEQKSRFVEMRARGLSYAKIAPELGVAKGTLSNWNRELEGRIAQLKAMELEALYEEFYLLKEGRIRLLGSIVRDLKAELDTRDLSEIPAEKLLDLLLRYQDKLLAEHVELRPLTDEEVEELDA